MSAGQPGKGTEGTEAAVRAGGPPRHVGQPVSGGEGDQTVFTELLRRECRQSREKCYKYDPCHQAGGREQH